MPTRWPDAVPRETLTFDVMPDLQAVRAGGWRVQLGAAELEADGAHRWMVDTYARMPGALGGAVREAARRLAGGPPKTDAPAQTRLLVHCTAGKDRTGFVVAMLLAAVGVPREETLEDYLESGRRQPPAALARRLLATAPERPDARGLAAIETIASVRPVRSGSLAADRPQRAAEPGGASPIGLSAPRRSDAARAPGPTAPAR